ncbi:sulfite exporter TauE/SafE family protein [Adhaeribacter swui]|uniref:Sulfite exporter TauE/SafE family protein n=1 Tax=Adhaeribacter swui TaxID=2086471 RepID=A0A7G7GDT3_9BACT|nr:sulfite exporter TauE/SafE family protein [Adhaeribacter swui]QNF35317.1 sulfite exporter TauE/SafE family protein [Adhaeribacter swui]
MNSDLQLLLVTAIGISFIHTLTGPDHYVPFIALSKSRNWSVSKTIACTVICGLGHVGSSIVLGLIGIGLGWSLSKLSWLEEVRGGLAGWGLLLFGILYTIWGIEQAYRNKPHKHFDAYNDGSVYVYEHRSGEIVYSQDRKKVTPWVLFIIFILGPCEPLIPLLSYPAAQNSTGGIFWLVGIFTLFTLLTMVLMVILGYYGISLFKSATLERYVHAIGGATIMVCGIGMLFLGW